jgi:hypothetical protein
MTLQLSAALSWVGADSSWFGSDGGGATVVVDAGVVVGRPVNAVAPSGAVVNKPDSPPTVVTVVAPLVAGAASGKLEG